MSDTPRTDAAVFTAYDEEGDALPAVDPVFARTLERELARLTAEVGVTLSNAELAEAIKRWACIEKLLEGGGTVILSGDAHHEQGQAGDDELLYVRQPHKWFRYRPGGYNDENLQSFEKMCPAAEFPAHAVAAIDAAIRNANKG